MRAFLSVYDKAGVADFAAGLAELGWDLVSSGGTAAALRDAGLVVTDVADLTGVPPFLDHRVVTLHPKVHGGILADRSNPEHRRDAEEYGIESIDLVVSNLYPFGSDPALFQHGRSPTEIELIDIGGPALVRAAAKNHAHVGVVVDPAEYDPVLEELRTAGALGADTRRRLARTAFAHTAAYDAAIVTWFDADADDASSGPLPPTLHLALEQAQITRYGENPHQRRAALRPRPQLPEPLRRRRCVAVCARPRSGTCSRDRQARQPVRRRHRGDVARGVPAGVRLRLPLCVRRDRGAQPSRGR